MKTICVAGEEITMDDGVVMGPEIIDPLQCKSEYERFLFEKTIVHKPSGLTTIDTLPSLMFPHQRDVTEWALKLGKSAVFLGTGMGKTYIELEWARQVSIHTSGRVLILAPLAVAKQTVREGQKFGIEAHYCAGSESIGDNMICVTNYERLEKFNPEDFDGVVLDESSILKSMDGKTRTLLIETFAATPYKLCATATPAPNDYTELGNHAEFLGTMTRMEMLSMFFAHDGGSTQDWRLKGHAKKDFWKWVCSWAVFMRKPSDVGYDDGPFQLPELRMHEHLVDTQAATEGMLFALPAETLQERIGARRATVGDRVEKAAEIAIESDDQFIIWCNLNSESTSLAKLITDAVEITGSDSAEVKEKRILDFIEGRIRVLVTKSSIFGFGLNLQNCHNQIFVGMNDSWESYYQAVRRCWRFGQEKPVNVHIIAATTEGNVLENIKRKERDAEKMADEMTDQVRDLVATNLHSTQRSHTEYLTNLAKGDGWELALMDCVDHARSLKSDSIHYSIYSPPFSSLYTYSNMDRDMGNSKTHDEFWQHYRFLIAEQYRALMPGRLVSIHCMNLPTSKVRHGYIGLRDFRGEIIKSFEDAGFIYHSEVVIWKDPVTAMQRTKALGLLHKQIKKDSCMSRQGIPDYLVTMRKPGDNPERVTHTNESFPVQLWQNYASPVWMDINPSETLQYRSARENEDERHICPLQLDVIRRGIRLWSNPGDTVWSPFAGIGSEGYVALQEGRTFIGSELKPAYWRVASENLNHAVENTFPLFSQHDEEVEETA
jgi:DNA modification methylase/superfamily II DNA or RNA helicase